MPIPGSTALASIAAPAANSTTPYTIYNVTNTTGVFLAGVILTNTSNIPVTYTLFQDSYNNVITSGTLAAGASLTISLNKNLQNGETLLAAASIGGVLQVEVDGALNALDPVSQMIFGMMLMMVDAWGVSLPDQNMLNAGAFTF